MAWPGEAGSLGLIQSRQRRSRHRRSRSRAVNKVFYQTLTVTTVRDGNITTVTAVSNLAGVVYYYWYVDGTYVTRTTAPGYSFYLDEDDQARVDVLASNDPYFDYVANAPPGYPARRSIWWVRSTDADVKYYRVEQNKDAAGWVNIGLVSHDSTEWSYHLLSPRLVDLSTYQWRVIPVDEAGNDGTALTLDSEKVIRCPDSPDFAYSYDGGTTKVTFSAA